LEIDGNVEESGRNLGAFRGIWWYSMEIEGILGKLRAFVGILGNWTHCMEIEENLGRIWEHLGKFREFGGIPLKLREIWSNLGVFGGN
jgi:hypothetical protein